MYETENVVSTYGGGKTPGWRVAFQGGRLGFVYLKERRRERGVHEKFIRSSETDEESVRQRQEGKDTLDTRGMFGKT